MWPLRRGSLQPQPVTSPPPLRPKSASAPQLSPLTAKSAPSRLPDLPEPDHSRQPQLCFFRLFSPSELIQLAEISAGEAPGYLISCLPEDSHMSRQLKDILGVLLYSVYRWAFKDGLAVEKISVLLTIYVNTFRYVNCS